MITKEFLKQSEIFKGLHDEQLEEIRKYCDVKEFRNGDKIFSEGDDATHLCIVLEGGVELRFDLPGTPSSDKNAITSVPLGKAFIWSSLVPPHKIRLSSYCNSKICKIIRINATNLKSLCEQDAKTGYLIMSNLTEVIGKRFFKLQDEVVKRHGYEAMFSW